MNVDHVFVAVNKKDAAVLRTTPMFRERAAVSGPAPGIADDITKTILHPHFANEKGEQKFVIVAHFAESVREFIKESCGDPFPTGRAWVCTSQLAWPLFYSGVLSQRTLPALAEHFRVQLPDGTVESQAVALRNVYKEMMRRFKTAILAEDAITELGGGFVESVRKMTGF